MAFIFFDTNQVVKLYERCLIACANYPEYWIRYVLCMEASGCLDLANNALARATQVFVKVEYSPFRYSSFGHQHRNREVNDSCSNIAMLTALS